MRAGEVVTSARAVDEGLLKSIYEFNRTIAKEAFGSTSHKRRAAHPADWAGHDIRAMLNLIYIIAFLCLLRFDEVLNLQWADIVLEDHSAGPRLKVSLLARKTHQNGGMRLHKCLLAH